jgi:hypothetical protein
MRQKLPAKPHIDHLKAQAKDLLEDFRAGHETAYARIRASVPAFAGRSNHELAQSSFALHDAQSAIAREYGCVSWSELRDEVARAQSNETVEPETSADSKLITQLRTLHPELSLPT